MSPDSQLKKCSILVLVVYVLKILRLKDWVRKAYVPTNGPAGFLYNYSFFVMINLFSSVLWTRFGSLMDCFESLREDWISDVISEDE